ncbi:MAG: ImmA/IrrE family metallo-endopeptidase [Anaeroplasmataceae bacterium]
MDFKTKAITRDEIRYYADIIRNLFNSKDIYCFDVIHAFEMLPVIFDNVTTEISLEDDPELSDIPSAIIPDSNGNYHIKIKESVYEGAHFDKVGGYRNHIMHEICHYFLFKFGYEPFMDTVYKNYELRAYESIEWQAKALAGEVLIPFELTKDLTQEQIEEKCKVSSEAAKIRIKITK